MKRLFIIAILGILAVLLLTAAFPSDTDMPAATVRVRHNPVHATETQAPMQRDKEPFAVTPLPDMFYKYAYPVDMPEEVPTDYVQLTKDPGDR